MPWLDAHISHQRAVVKSPMVKLAPWFELFAVSLTAADSLCPPLHCFWQPLQEFWFVTSIWLQLSPLTLHSTTHAHRAAATRTHTHRAAHARTCALGQHVAAVCFATLLVWLPNLCSWAGLSGAERHLPEENKHDSLQWRHLPFESQRGCLNSCQSAARPGPPLVEQRRVDGREMCGGRKDVSWLWNRREK